MWDSSSAIVAWKVSHLRVIIQREKNASDSKNTPTRGLSSARLRTVPMKSSTLLAKQRRFVMIMSIFPSSTVSNHSIELIPLFEGSSTDAFIGVDLNQRPIRMSSNKLLIIFLLQLIRSSLPDIIRRDANVNRNPLVDIIVVIARLFLRWNEQVVFRIDSYAVPLLDFLFLLFFSGVCFRYQASSTPPIKREGLPLHLRAALPNPQKENTPLSWLSCR